MAHSAFLRFLVVGSFSYVLSVAFIALCVEVFHVHYAVSMVIGYFLVVCVSHFVNRRVAFASRGGYLSELGRYHVVSLTAFIAGTGLMAVLVEFGGVHYLVANAVAAFSVACMSFLMHRVWTFAQNDGIRLEQKSRPRADGRCRTIVQVASYYPTHLGGLEIAAWKLAQTIACTDRVIYFAAGQPPRECVKWLDVRPAKCIDPLDKWLGIPMPIWSMSSVRELRDCIRIADVVHVHETLYFGSVAAACLATFYGRPLVLTIHTSEPKFRGTLPNYLFCVAHRLVSRRMLRAADRVVFVGSTGRDFHVSKVSLSSRELIAENGVDRGVFHSVSDEMRSKLRERLGLPASGLIFLYVGRMVGKKGVNNLIDVALRLKQVTWVFVGDGPVKVPSVDAHNVSCLGSRAHEDIADFYRAADLVVSPGIGEGGITMVVKEAMSCGTPVLVSDEVATAFGETLPSGVFKLGTSDVRDLERALRELAFDPSGLVRVRSAVANYACRWSWATTAGQYLQVYAAATSARIGNSNRVSA